MSNLRTPLGNVRSNAEGHSTRLYVQHYGLPFFERLIASMTSGPLCVLLLARVDAIAELRSRAGPTDPHMAKQVDPTCLRAVYGRTPLDNAVHASKNATEAEREEDALFQRKKRTIILFGPPAVSPLAVAPLATHWTHRHRPQRRSHLYAIYQLAIL